VSREGLSVREVTVEEGNKLLRIVRRSSGSVVTWRRAQMVLLSVQGMDVAGIAKVSFTSPDRVREVLNNFNADGFDALYPRYAGGRPPTFTLPQRQEIKKIALSRPADHGLPFSTWSLSKLAEFLVAEGVVDDISHEGLRELLRREEVSFQAVKTWKQSTDPDYEPKKNRVLELYDIAEGKAEPGPGDPTVVFSMDEFGPLNLQPRPGRQWAAVVRRTKKGTTDSPRRRRIRATYTRTKGVRHLLAALDMNRDRLSATSRSGRPAPSSSPSAATCAASTRRRCASPSSSTTSHRTCRRGRTPASATGRTRTTSSSPTCRPTPRSSTGSSVTSPPCATSPSTAPTTRATSSRTR
jgi:transposase